MRREPAEYHATDQDSGQRAQRKRSPLTDRPDREHRRHDTDDHAREEKKHVFSEDDPPQRAALESDGLQQAKFTAALEHGAREQQTETSRREHQTQSTQRTKNPQIRILHGIKFVQPVRSRRQSQSAILQQPT